MELHVGVDVSKKTLDVYINDIDKKEYDFENNQAGIEKFLGVLKALQLKDHDIQLIICEATGGYEKLLSDLCHFNNFPIHVVHPNKVKSFAKATGTFAKTDKIDAKILNQFARVFQPTPDQISLSPELETLRALVIRRQQLLEEKNRETNRLDKGIGVVARQSIEKHVRWLEKALHAIENAISKQVKNNPKIQESVELLESVPGIGILTAVILLVELPELGQIGDKQLASLVGVAPMNKDSGTKSGKRSIRGGRSFVRKILYMAALTSSRFNPDMKKFYQGLRARGKVAKVALTAVLHKLLILLNSIARRRTPWEHRIGAVA
jgi:transposase